VSGAEVERGSLHQHSVVALPHPACVGTDLETDPVGAHPPWYRCLAAAYA